MDSDSTENQPKVVERIAKVVLCGDVMLGRLIDQMFPEHNEDEEDAEHVKYYLNSAGLQGVHHTYVWGDLLPLLKSANLRIINLETSVTTNPHKWPDKAFNYRMHPANLKCLTEAKIDYCSLANNHTLDYQLKGMLDTISHLEQVRIKWAGVGNNIEQAKAAAILEFNGVKMACFSFADHYKMWAASENNPGINYIDPEEVPQGFFAEFKQRTKRERNRGANLIAVSLHWGGNYAWTPPKSFNMFAHRLVDDCGVDLIHGHSSHHVQGIEIYKGKPIIYGCGDFVDDYAVDKDYRNDLGFLYTLHLDTITKKWVKLELTPTHIHKFQVSKATGTDKKWLFSTIQKLSASYGTKWTENVEGNLSTTI